MNSSISGVTACPREARDYYFRETARGWQRLNTPTKKQNRSRKGYLARRREGAVDVEEREDARIPRRRSHRHPSATTASSRGRSSVVITTATEPRVEDGVGLNGQLGGADLDAHAPRPAWPLGVWMWTVESSASRARRRLRDLPLPTATGRRHSPRAGWMDGEAAVVPTTARHVR